MRGKNVDGPASATMRSDWNERARENARYYIASDNWETEEEFDRSGERDVEIILSDMGEYAPPEATVLEIGCGAGRMLKPLAKRFKRVYGVDVSTEMIRLAEERLQGLRNVQTWSNNGQDLEYLRNASVDLVISYVTFQHIPDRGAIIAYINEAYRVLRPGGAFKFQVHGREDTPESAAREAAAKLTTWRGAQFTKPEIIEITRAAGFEIAHDYSADEGALPVSYLWVAARRPR